MSNHPAADLRIPEVEAEYLKIKYPSLLVHEARVLAGRDGDLEMVYGTTPPDGVLQLLDYASATSEDVFYDLGCGLGVPTVVAALVCQRAVGIELLPEVARQAQEVAAALGLANASFRVGDLKSAAVSDATLIYCYSTCLREESRVMLAGQAATTRPGSRILTVTHGLDHPQLHLEETRELGWEGRTRNVYLYRRR